MTLVSPKTVLQVVQAVKAKPNSALFGQNPLCLNLPSRFLSRAFNSSVSCQTSVDVCEHLGGEVHEGMQVRLSETLEQKVQYKGGEVLEGDVQVRLSAKLEQKVHQKGVPLGDVVENCVRRWFKEYLKKAKEGDPDSQAIVGQMFCSGYGAPRDIEKGQGWIKKAEWKRKTLASTKGLLCKRKTGDEEYFFV